MGGSHHNGTSQGSEELRQSDRSIKVILSRLNLGSHRALPAKGIIVTHRDTLQSRPLFTVEFMS